MVTYIILITHVCILLTLLVVNKYLVNIHFKTKRKNVGDITMVTLYYKLDII